jgi:phosphohistidine phosphatase SixA
MAIHLVRHAKAGDRPAWHQPDDLRPLTNAGLVQALVIADALLPREVVRVVSSRYVRCTQTVQALADKVGLTVESHPALAEEAGITESWSLLEDIAASGQETVLCSHGNIIGGYLDRLHRRGIDLVADERTCRKGSIWTINVVDGEIANAVLTLAQA